MSRPYITLVYNTARVAHCFADHPDWSQYDILVASCQRQTFRDFEVVVVDAAGECPPGLDCSVPTRVVPPLNTQWRRVKSITISSCVNAGLAWSRGDVVCTMCDCSELEPDYFTKLVRWTRQGLAVSAMVAAPDGKLVDARSPWFELHARADGITDSRAPWFEEHVNAEGWLVLGRDGPTPHGLMAVPMTAFERCGGWDHHFDGGYGLDDCDMSTRLRQLGVQFVMDRAITMMLYEQVGFPEHVIVAGAERVLRCCNPAWTIARKRGLINPNVVPYTRQEALSHADCYLRSPTGMCGYWQDKDPCGYSHLNGGHPIARRIMLDEGEATWDLAAERRKNGVSR